MENLKKVKEAGIVEEFQAVVELLKAVGYETGELTIVEVAKIRHEVFKAIKSIEQQLFASPHTPILKYVYTQMKQGDKVTCITQPGVWELVWYKEGDTTCAIQNKKYRYIVKVATLTKVKEQLL